MASYLNRLRIKQIQIASGGLRRICAVPLLFGVIKRVREWPGVRTVLRALAGYNRPFPSLKEASAAIAGWEGGGHANGHYLAAKLPEAETARPGDYEAMFYIARHRANIGHVFDLGGSVGNLFYCYDRYIGFPPDLVWTVCDLPDTNRLGTRLALEQAERRLRFTEKLEDAREADLLIVSGALHYFEETVSEMLQRIGGRPSYVLVNRAPLVEAPSIATIQDGGSYRLACKLHNRDDLIEGLARCGYRKIDEWRIPQRAVVIPCFPDQSAHFYSGLFFSRQSAA